MTKYVQGNAYFFLCAVSAPSEQPLSPNTEQRGLTLFVFPSTEDRTDRELQWEPLSEEETKLLDQVSDASPGSSSSPSGSRSAPTPWTPPRTVAASASSTPIPVPSPDQDPDQDPGLDPQARPAGSALSRLMDYWTWPRSSAAEEPDDALMF